MLTLRGFDDTLSHSAAMHVIECRFRFEQLCIDRALDAAIQQADATLADTLEHLKAQLGEEIATARRLARYSRDHIRGATPDPPMIVEYRPASLQPERRSRRTSHVARIKFAYMPHIVYMLQDFEIQDDFSTLK